MWNDAIKDEDDFFKRLESLPFDEYYERIVAIQEYIMHEIIEQKRAEGKMVFFSHETGMFN